MKKRDSRLRIRLFYALLIVPTVLWLLLSLAGLADSLDYDTGEKRSKHEIAEDTSVSDLTSELESYYDDRVPFRSVLLSVNSYVSYIAELPYTKVIEPVIRTIANAVLEEGSYPAALYLQEESTGDSGSDSGSSTASSDSDDDMQESAGSKDSGVDKDEDEDTSDILPSAVDSALGTLLLLPASYEEPKQSGYFPYRELTSDVIRGRDGWLFTTESLEDYTGENMPTDEKLKEKMDALAVLDQFCREREIELYTFVMPNKNVVYPEYMPSIEQTNESAAAAFEDLIHENTGINFEYLDEELLGCKVYGQLYYTTDTHWNDLGALAAYAYMRNTMGLSPVDLSKVTWTKGEEYSGDLAQYTGLPSFSFPDDYSLDIEYQEDTDYEIVRTGDDYIDETVSEDAENDQTVVLIGDSFRHSLFEFISKDYTHAYSLNQLLLDEEMVEILEDADVIILESVERNLFSEDYYDNTVGALGAVLSVEEKPGADMDE